MAHKIVIRLIGTLACLAVIGTAWDAEAGHRRHQRRACCSTEPCCAPVCRPVCAPVCDPCCAPVAAPVFSTTCCPREYCGCAVVRREVIMPICCQASIVSNGIVFATKTKESAVKLTAQPQAAMPVR